MDKVVTHFVRKSSQLAAPFIHNQIAGHSSYKPTIVFKYEADKNDSGFAPFEQTLAPLLNLSEGNDPFINYYYFKKVSQTDSGKIFRFLKEHKSVILHLHYGTDAYLYLDVMAKSNLPSVVSFYGYDIEEFPKFLFGLGKIYLKNGVFKYSSKILAMSPYMKDVLVDCGCSEEKIVVHYHGIKTQALNSIQRDYKLRDIVQLLILGRLDYSKGHLFLLGALKKIRDSGISNFKLNIVGAGPLKAKIEKFVLEHGLTGFVRFAGSVQHLSKEMISAFANADMFVHPCVPGPNGFREGIPGTIVEAMASGLPVISTYHAGIPSVMEHGKTGLLVNEWDTDALAGSILKLMSDVQLREKLGRAARQHAIENLDLQKKETELEQIYDSLIR